MTKTYTREEAETFLKTELNSKFDDVDIQRFPKKMSEKSIKSIVYVIKQSSKLLDGSGQIEVSTDKATILARIFEDENNDDRETILND